MAAGQPPLWSVNASPLSPRAADFKLIMFHKVNGAFLVLVPAHVYVYWVW